MATQDKALQEDVKLAPEMEAESAEKEAEEEATKEAAPKEKEKFSAEGEKPAVAAAAPAVAAAATAQTASQMAYDGDSVQTELRGKLTSLVDTQFDGDVKKAFLHYGDRHSHDPNLDKAELTELLTDAKIGNSMSRGEWATAIMEKLDKGKTGHVSWKEFQTIVTATKKADPSAAKAAPAPAAAPPKV